VNALQFAWPRLTVTDPVQVVDVLNRRMGQLQQVLTFPSGIYVAGGYLLGDVFYCDTVNSFVRLPGNITTTKQYLSQTGTGVVSAAPAWAQIAFADLSGGITYAQLPSGTGTWTNTGLTLSSTLVVGTDPGSAAIFRVGGEMRINSYIRLDGGTGQLSLVTGFFTANTPAIYSSTNNNLEIGVNSTRVALFTSAAFTPATAGLLTIGTAALPFGPVFFQPGTAATSAKASGVLYQNQGLTTTSGSDTSLASYTLKGGTLAANGQQVRITVTGRTLVSAGSANIKFGATAIATGSLSAGSFTYAIVIARSGSATQFSHAVLVDSAVTATDLYTAPAETLASDIVIDFRGNAGALGTLDYDTICVEYLAA